MLRSIRMVAWTMMAIAVLPLFAPCNVRGQNTESSGSQDDRVIAERTIADRYEQILRSRPQMGSAFDKFYEFHSKQGTVAGLCERLEASAAKSKDGHLFQLLGLVQLRFGSLDESIENLTIADVQLPNEPFASLYLSKALFQKRQYTPAVAALKKAADRKPNQIVTLEILKDLAQVKNRDVEIAAVVELLINLKEQYSTNPQVIEKLADAFIDFGRPENALPLYENLVQLTRDPQRKIELRILLANLKKRLGEPEQALSDLEQLASQVKPQSWLHTSVLERIQQLTEELHGSEGLIEYYSRAALKSPEDIATQLRLARILSNQSRFEEANEWIAKAIEAAPDSPEPLLALTDLMEETKQISQAIASIQAAVKLDPTNQDYIVRWGELAAREPKVTLAVQQSNASAIWRRLLVGHEKEAARMIQVAELLRSIELREEAVKFYEQAISLSGNSIEYSERFADYLAQIDRRDDALKVLKSAVVASENSRESLIRLSEVLFRLQFRDEALLALQKGCEVKADFNDLLRLATALSEREQVDAALETLDRAARLAEESTQFADVWNAQTTIYKRNDRLPEQIVALAKELSSTSKPTIESIEKLAILQAADGQRAEAASTALSATSVHSESARAWWLTAKLQREAGLSLREVESLTELCKLDERHAADYLQRIAAIQFQLNQFDEAMATTERMLALPNSNLQHVQVAVSFCLQAKKTERAVELLRRASQLFPNDRSAWVLLATQLLELRDNAGASEAAYRVLELSREKAQQREAIDMLVKSRPSASDFAQLLAGLKQFGIEHDREGDVDLWTAWVMLDIRGSQSSTELLANVMKRNYVEPELLRAAVELAVGDKDFSRATDLQKRLCREDANAENRLKLGELLWLDGDSQAAAQEWQDVMRSRINDTIVIAFAKALVDKEGWNAAVDLIDIAAESSTIAWELIAIGIHANIQCKKLSKAAELSERLLAMKLAQATLFKDTVASASATRLVPETATDRLAWLEHAGAWQSTLNVIDVSRAGFRTSQNNPRASQAAAVRHLAIQRGATLRSNPMTKFNVHCFAEARALAMLVKFGKLNQKQAEVSREWETYVAKAIDSKDIERLWDCVLVMEPLNSQSISLTTSGAIEYRDSRDQATHRYAEILDALVSAAEPAARELAINDIVLRRQLQHQMADRLKLTVPPMEAKEFARLQNLVTDSDGLEASSAFAGNVTLAIELIRLNRTETGDQMMEKAVATITDESRLATFARQFLANDSPTCRATAKILVRGFELELKSGIESSELANAISIFRSSGSAADLVSQDFIRDLIQLQAAQVAGLTRDMIFSDSRSNESRRAYRNFRKLAWALPDRSSLYSASLRNALVDIETDAIVPTEGDLKDEDRLARAERTVRWFCASVSQSALNDPQLALEFLKKAKEQAIAPEVVSLYEVWLLVSNQKLEEARDVVNQIEAPNEAILRECELWKMDIANKLGNSAETLRAAKVLEKLPLSVYENADVAAALHAKTQTGGSRR